MVSTLFGCLSSLPPSLPPSLLPSLCVYLRQVVQYSDKNSTGVQDINDVFGPVIFENISPSQSERLLGYLISTFEFIIT